MFVEREDCLQEIESLIALAEAGRGQIVLLSGEAGIGKTSVLHALRQSASNDLHWAWGGCDALLTPRPLGPLHDMADALGVSFVEKLQTPGDRSALYDELISVLEQVPRVTILVFEDIHWADFATLDLIKFLARRIAFMRVLLVATLRDDDIGEDHHLRRVLGELPSASTHRLQLAPLSQKAIAKLADQADVSADGLFEITGGNPFFVTELIAARQSSGASLPSSIRDAVAAQLGRLPHPTRELLELISIIPRASPIRRLEAVVGGLILDLAEPALQRGLIEQDAKGGIKFRHELARLATLERLPAARRRALHLSVFNTLAAENNDAVLDQIVHHAAGGLDGQAVLKYATRAAEVAARAGAHREAAGHLATALRFVDDAEPEVAAGLYERWAYEASLAARIDDEVLEARRHAITLWRMLERPEKVGENLRGLSRLHWYRGEAAEATRFADQAVRLLESTPPSAEHAMAYSLRSQLHMLNDQMDDAVRWGKKALALEQQFENPDLRMHALNNVGTAMVFRGNVEGIALLEESLRLALTMNHQEHAARAYNNLAEYAVEFRQFDLAERMLSDGLAYDTENDLDSWTHYLSGRFAQLRLDQGRLTDAQTIAQGVIDHDRLTLLMKLPAGLVLSRAQLRLGRPGALTLMRDVLKDALATDELQHIVPARLGLVEAAWLLDQEDLADEHLAALLDLSEADRHPWNIGEMAIWAKRLGSDAGMLLTRNIPEPFRFELAGQYRAAAKVWSDLGLPYAAAIALAQEKTAEALSEALTSLENCGAQAAVAKIRKIALQEGHDQAMPRVQRGPYKGARDHPLGLTLKEQQVLDLLAKGYTNREISERLSRSQRTVEHHVSSILSKLNAKSRMAAVLRVQNEPWLSQPNQQPA